MDFDFNTINSLADLAGSAGKNTGAVIDAVGKIKDLLGSKKPEDQEHLNDLLMEMREKLTETRMQNVDLKEAIIELREALLKQQEKENEFNRYELIKTEEDDLIYSLKDDDERNEPHHYICPRCKEDGIKSIMKARSSNAYCDRCNSSIALTEPKPINFSSTSYF